MPTVFRKSSSQTSHRPRGRRRAGVLVTLALVLLAASLVANAQPAEKVQRIGWLRHTSPPPPDREALLHGLRDMGYVEGQNLVLDIRHGEGKTEALPALAAELVRLPVAVLVSSSIAATRAAQAATSTIPIVFTNVTDPVDQGLIASWAQPGEHLTGVANGGKEAEAKRWEFLKETVPTATRIAALVPVDNPAYKVLGPTAPNRARGSFAPVSTFADLTCYPALREAIMRGSRRMMLRCTIDHGLVLKDFR